MIIFVAISRDDGKNTQSVDLTKADATDEETQWECYPRRVEYTNNNIANSGEQSEVYKAPYLFCRGYMRSTFVFSWFWQSNISGVYFVERQFVT